MGCLMITLCKCVLRVSVKEFRKSANIFNEVKSYDTWWITYLNRPYSFIESQLGSSRSFNYSVSCFIIMRLRSIPRILIPCSYSFVYLFGKLKSLLATVVLVGVK